MNQASDAGRGPWRSFLETWSAPLRESLDKLVVDLKSDAGRVLAGGGALRDAVEEAVTARVLPAVRAAGATPRAAALLRESVLILAAYRWHAIRAATMSAEAASIERAILDERCAERVYRMCIDLRGAILKLGQWVSTRRDLLPPAYIEALSRLQDSVPPVDFAVIAGRIRDELGEDAEALLARIDPDPLAAGSLAQVHAAVLPDGTRVAVKVQVPGVEAQFEGDLAFLRVVAGAVADLAPALNLVPVAAELGQAIRRELDFRREADNARRVADDHRGDAAVLVPRVHPRWSTARVLTMDRIDGDRLTDFLESERESAETVLATLIRTYATQILRTGHFQADPHPGNFLVDAQGRLALLDFGSIHELDPQHRGAYAALTMSVIGRDQPRTVELMTQLGFAPKNGGDVAALVQFADLLLDAFRPAPDRPLSAIDPRQAFEEAVSLGRQSPIAIPEHFVQIGRVLTALAGLVLAYRPSIDLWSLLAPALVESPMNEAAP